MENSSQVKNTTNLGQWKPEENFMSSNCYGHTCITFYLQVEKMMNNEPFYIETKVDGERIQLHKEKNAFMYFSRR